jgi:putative heme degradation protein
MSLSLDVPSSLAPFSSPEGLVSDEFLNLDERLAVNTVCGQAIDEWERMDRPFDFVGLIRILNIAAARAVKLVRDKTPPKGAA